MGFNKRFISEKSIRSIANRNDYKYFFNYFKSDAIIVSDNFSSDILNEIQKYTINDKNDIIRIMKFVNSNIF